MAQRFPSEIPFASLLVYSVSGTSDVSRLSRAQVRDPLKSGDRTTLARVAQRVDEGLETFGDFFGPDVGLVPMPRSSPIRQEDLWPSRLICNALLERGLAGSVHECITRTREVAKAAVTPGPRKVRPHLDSLQVQLPLDLPPQLLIVDDVVTSGSTLYAAAQLFGQPERVRVFAVLSCGCYPLASARSRALRRARCSSRSGRPTGRLMSAHRARHLRRRSDTPGSAGIDSSRNEELDA